METFDLLSQEYDRDTRPVRTGPCPHGCGAEISVKAFRCWNCWDPVVPIIEKERFEQERARDLELRAQKRQARQRRQ